LSSLHFNKVNSVVPNTSALLIGFLVVGQSNALKELCERHNWKHEI